MEYTLANYGLLIFVNSKSKRIKNTSLLVIASIQGTLGRQVS